MIRHLLGRKEILSPRQLRDRLMRELETNVALRVEKPILRINYLYLVGVNYT